MGGNKLNIIKFYNDNYSIDDIKSRFKYLLCSFCKKIIVDAYQIRCGCRMCRACRDKCLVGGYVACPVRLEVDCDDIKLKSEDDFSKDFICDKDILNVKVKCCHENCDYEDLLRNMENHHDKCVKNLIVDESRNVEVKVGDKLNELEIKLNGLKRKLEEVNEEFGIKLKKKDDEIEELKLNLLKKKDSINLLWKIDDVANKIERKSRVVSPSFYTEENGYKMMLLLYMDGSQDVDKGYLSLFFQIIKGEWDDILEWPFKRDVTFELVSYVDEKNFMGTMKYDVLYSECFQKPVTQSNTCYGYPEFHKISELSPNYLINNSMFIKCHTKKSGRLRSPPPF